MEILDFIQDMMEDQEPKPWIDPKYGLLTLENLTRKKAMFDTVNLQLRSLRELLVLKTTELLEQTEESVETKKVKPKDKCTLQSPITSRNYQLSNEFMKQASELIGFYNKSDF